MRNAYDGEGAFGRHAAALHDNIEKHRRNDRIGKEEKGKDREKLKKLERNAGRIPGFLETREERKGAGGETVKSNVTDNESGRMKGPHGMIQGYNGIAAADSKNRIIIAADAYGTAAEGQCFRGMAGKTGKNMKAVKGKKRPLEKTVMPGDRAYFSEDNPQMAKKKGIEAVIPDTRYRGRDEEIKDGDGRAGKERFDGRYFKYNKEGNYYVCPNKKKLFFRSGAKLNRNEAAKYESRTSGCSGCPYTGRCINPKSRKRYRTLSIPVLKYKENLSQQMR